jgi:hypothetical protein
MKKTNFLNIFGAVIISFGLIYNISLVDFKNVNNSSLLSSFSIMALAKGEVEDPCVGDYEQMKQPKTGALCTCKGQVVIPQTCENVSDPTKSCSPISCD